MDPRVARTHDKVRRATLSELAEGGYAGLTVDAVARRSGVARTTIYRHWDSPSALALDALETLNTQPRVEASDAPAAEQVRTLLAHLASALADPLVGGCLVALIEGARRDPALRTLLADYSARRGAALVRVVEAGVADGSFTEVDAPSAADALAGAVFYRTLVAARPPDRRALDRLVLSILG